MTDAQPQATAAEETEAIKRRSAQAMAATYVQMVRHAELARSLHLARARSTQRRLARSTDPEESARLARQLGAQERQGASIDSAVERFRSRMGNLSAFRDAGLTEEDFTALGLTALLQSMASGPAEAAQQPAPALGELGDHLAGAPATPTDHESSPSE